MATAAVAALACGLLAAHAAFAEDLPSCLRRVAEQAPQEVLLAVRPGDEELLARLVYAEARSTGFAGDPRVARGIAWGVMNRVRLGEVSASARRRYGSGVAGVIFQPQQFNPAVSRRSPFAAGFLCPQDAAAWRLAFAAAGMALRGHDAESIACDAAVDRHLPPRRSAYRQQATGEHHLSGARCPMWPLRAARQGPAAAVRGQRWFPCRVCCAPRCGRRAPGWRCCRRCAGRGRCRLGRGGS
ncbi:hypothetical protein E4Q08_09480 [Candidatus Accumulibacter phosphatis]|uniref:Cell wall hydrolase SleB domain-containing protein n=1 Tax=Candidatus Accumulibacter contiguus TaxID=2954381 RepID=A0ABX1T9H8_9PROT|nr:hypothetical protein [Candidatus Accumulibacter contiguus]